MRVLFVPLAAATFAFGLVTAATELIGDEPIAPSRPTGIVWADRVFATKHDFAGWLKSKGARYEAWSVRHPAAAAVLERRGAPGPAASPASPPKPRRLASARPAETQDHSTLAVGLVIVSALGLLALLSALRLRWLRPAYARRVRYGPMLTRLNVGRGLRRPPVGRVAIERALVSSLSSARGAGTELRRRITDHWPSGEDAGTVEPEPEAVAATPPPRQRRNPFGVLQQLAPHRALIATPVAKSLAASRGAWAELAERVALRRAQHDEANPAEYGATLSREALRRYAPDIAWGVTSILLALAIGASIAMYLN